MSSITQKIDELLKDDRTFTTRAGMRFMTEVVKDAFKFIEDEKERNKQNDSLIASIMVRLGHVENGLNEFLTIRSKEQEAAAGERMFYRRAVIGGLITIILSQIAQWFFR
jgi:hypothetical protein